MTATTQLTFARFFRRFRHPIPQSYAICTPYDCLLERYNLLQADGRSNQTPLLHMFPSDMHPLPDLIQRLDATLWTAFRRSYTHILYSADNNLQHLQPLPFIIVRQWIHQNPKHRPSISVASFLEPAGYPLQPSWGKYWTVINNDHSIPPPHFWTAPPLMLSQDAGGIFQYPGPVPELK